MNVRRDIRRGRPDRLNLRRRVSAYSRQDRVANFKIGISSDPKERAMTYEGTYGEMVVLYETQSERFVRDIERFLIDNYWYDCDNIIGGGGGRLGKPPYYLYVALQKGARPSYPVFLP